MDKQKTIEENERRKISKMICARCDLFNGNACTVNKTGECDLAKGSAESIIIAGYGNIQQALTGFVERLKKRMFANGFRTALHSYIIDETLKEFFANHE